MTNQETARSIQRIQSAEIEMKRYDLAEAGEFAQMEAIAQHYCAHAQLAVDALEIVKLGRMCRLDQNSADALRYLIGQIKANHARDLGVELSWIAKPAA